MKKLHQKRYENIIIKNNNMKRKHTQFRQHIKTIFFYLILIEPNFSYGFLQI